MTFNIHLLRQRAAEIREKLDLLRAAAARWEQADDDLYRLMVVYLGESL